MVPNHSVLEGKLAECITGCSPIPSLLPRAGAVSSKSRSGSTVFRTHTSPVICSFVLHSSVVTEPILLLGQQFRKFSLLIVVSLCTWMTFFIFSGSFHICPFLGHGLFIFWVSDTELDEGCLSLTLALGNKLDCKSVTQQILNSVTSKHKASMDGILPMTNCYQ